MRNVILRSILSLTAAVALSGSAWAAGDIEGQILFDGEPPKPKVLIAKGANVKDAEVCAADEKLNKELVVDPESKGIANVFIYLRKAPSGIPADLKAAPKEPVVFDQKGCEFVPHALIVRTGQGVVVKSGDPIPHNTHTHPLRNNEDNFIVRPNDREGIELEYNQPEPLPTKVDCDIHPHMNAYWLIVDHPYAAVTGEDGKFTITGLPAGKHEFTVWHEKVGYVDRKYVVTVKDGEVTTLDPMKVPAAKLTK